VTNPPSVGFDWRGTSDTSIGSTSLVVDRYVHYVAVFDGMHALLYRDSVLDDPNTPTTTSPIPEFIADFTVGVDHNASDYFFGGSLDELAIYARALSTAEVASHYSQGTAKR
jgi:hypothetical protein